MSTPEPTSQDDRRAGAQLNGWKEIAAFFGKGVRTVQRWEREMGLPVRRLPGPRGEIVFALPSELHAWRQKLEQGNRNGEDPKLEDGSAPSPAASAGGVEPAPPAPSPSVRFRSGRYLVRALALVALVGVAAFVGRLTNNGSRSPHRAPAPAPATGEVRGPATGEVRGNTLVALDERGAPLWSHRFDAPLAAPYASPWSAGHLSRIADIDRDGRAETLFFAIHQSPQESAFYCFESDGRIRFKRTLADRHTYGKEVFAGPWVAHRLLTHEPTLRSGEIWIAWTHGIEFPSVVQRLDAKGTLLNEFWNDGYISTFVPVERGPRRLLLVGGTNNEHKTAFLAVIDRRFTGFSPALNDKYACKDCEGAHPERYLVFPRLDVAVVQEYLPWTLRIEPDEAGQTMIGVSQSADPGAVYYRFDSDFNLIRSEIGPEYAALHRQLEAQRLLLRPFGPADERAAANVRAWDGRSFAPLPGRKAPPSATASRAGKALPRGTR